MVDFLMYWSEAVLLLAIAVLPGAIAGVAIGSTRGRPGAGLCSGAMSGTVGGVIGFRLYMFYLSTLPFEVLPTEMGPYHHILDPPPLYVTWLSIIGGSLILATLSTAVFVRRPPAQASKEPDRAGNT